MTEPKDYNIDEILAWTDECITTRIMREPTTEEAFIVDMRLRLTEAFAKEIKAQLFELITKEIIGEDQEILYPNDDIHVSWVNAKNQLRQIQRQKALDLFNIKEK